MLLQKINYWLLLSFLFLLPWQSRWVYESRFLNGAFWEYGSSSWYATEVLLWVIIILSSIDLFRKKELWQRIKTGQGSKRRLVIALLIIGYLIFEIFHSIGPAVSFNFVFRLISTACLFVILLSLSSRARPSQADGGSLSNQPIEILRGVYPERAERVERAQNDKWRTTIALWLGGVIQGLLALWQFFTQRIVHWPFSGIAPHLPQDFGAFVIEAGQERWLRAYGAFGSPNILGGFLAITFLLGLILYLKTPPSWQRIGFMVGNLIITSGLVLSFSRAAWVAVAVGATAVLIYVIASDRRERRNPLACGVLDSGDSDVIRPPRLADSLLGMTLKQLVFSLAVAAILFLALKPLFLVRTQSIGRLEQVSLVSRQEQFGEWKKIFKEYPVFGVGPGVYTLALYQNNPNLPVWRYQPIHNIYLLILAEVGVIGFTGVLVFLCFSVFIIWRRNHLFLPVLTSILILGLFDHWLWSMFFGLMVTSVVLGHSVVSLDKMQFFGV